ncbi:MAG TPA: fibronectin type III domain-containing protein [Phycisphaerales bacterium]|nr:fibronectin type III domain-containing protein [Phycisphaerales bacterium]
MGAYPTSPRPAFMAWCRAHTAVFADNAPAIGLTPAQAAAYAEAVAAAEAALGAQEEARLAYAAATAAAEREVTALRDATAGMVRSVRTFAENGGGNAVYQLAQVPAPRGPSPLLAPGQPTNLSAALVASSGALEIRWKSNNPRSAVGTSYIVRRRLSPAAAFEFVGVAGTKRFVDASLPAGLRTVQYTVQGQRAGAAGPVSPILTVRFGGAGAEGAAAVERGGAERRAA